MPISGDAGFLLDTNVISEPSRPRPDARVRKLADWIRSNLVKNLCLLGVCVQLGQHVPGRYSLDGRKRPPVE